jgi:hypothetical protein
LLLWLPADGRLLWQLAELAAVHGDARAAADLLDLCVGEYRLNHPTLRRHRAATLAALAAPAAGPPRGTESQKVEHTAHTATKSPLTFQSRRALLVRRFDPRHLPAVRKTGVNELSWGLLLETTVDARTARPGFHAHLKALDGLKVTLTGFMQPISDELDTGAFLLVEAPVGCWYCEMPEATGIILIELPADKTVPITRHLLKVTGTLELNDSDPENFFYTVKDAVVGEPD